MTQIGYSSEYCYDCNGWTSHTIFRLNESGALRKVCFGCENRRNHPYAADRDSSGSVLRELPSRHERQQPPVR